MNETPAERSISPETHLRAVFISLGLAVVLGLFASGVWLVGGFQEGLGARRGAMRLFARCHRVDATQMVDRLLGDDDVEVRDLFEQLERRRALPGNDRGIVIRMDWSGPKPVHDFRQRPLAIIKGWTAFDDTRAITLNRGPFHRRRGGRHHDEGRDPPGSGGGRPGRARRRGRRRGRLLTVRRHGSSTAARAVYGRTAYR